MLAGARVLRKHRCDLLAAVNFARMASPVDDALAVLARTDARLVLAVSGGLDSMVLLDAAVRSVRRERLTVASFDHGTGEAATEATALVAEVAEQRGLVVHVGGGEPLASSEAAWRAARWRFLREVAAATGSGVVTAHTEDDQLETVVMREMRGTGARGLAGLYAPGDVVRPFVRLPRAQLAAYAHRHHVRWLEDPSNTSTRFLRNRLRQDVLPALEAARPELRRQLLTIAERAAYWRSAMDAVADACCPTRATGPGVVVAAADFVGYDPASLAVLWPSIAARVGLALDQRGTHRLAAFTITSTPGAVMPLSGGWEVERTAEMFSLQRLRPEGPALQPLTGSGAVQWGRWCFSALSGPCPTDAWSAVLPADRPLAVREWQPTDRVRSGPGLVRVKRMLAEAGITAADRVGWPVVVADDAIVWIPGVSRVSAATARSGRPGVCIRCDPSHR